MSTSHHDHDHADLPPPRLDEVSDAMYAYVQPDGSWWINNCGVIVGEEGVLVIDTCATERRTRAFLDTVAGVTSAPIRTLVNTHHHGDHTHGNHLTGLAARIGHERCRAEILAAGDGVSPVYDRVWPGVQWGEVKAAPPFITFDDHLKVWVDDLEVQLHYIGGPAHTTNDVIAWIPSRRVLYTGDLVFNGGTPFMLMGSITGSMAAVEQLRRFPADVLVPGHGGLCTTAVLDRLVAYYDFVWSTAEAGRAAGLSPLEVALETDLGDFAALLDQERIVGNLHRAYAELDGAEPGAPINLPAAIGDMITYNGGRPLRCLA